MISKKRKAEYDRRYRRENIERLRAYDRERYAKDANFRRERERHKYQNDPEHRQRVRTYSSEYRKRDYVKKRLRLRHLKQRYGLTADEFVETKRRQNHRCAICNSRFRKRGKLRPCVDHCHATGRVRGLLCNACNLSEGWVARVGLSKIIEYYNAN